MNSIHLANAVLNTMFSESTETFFLGLSSTLPNADGTGVTEPELAGYQRVRIEGFSSAEDGAIFNLKTVVFPPSTGIWFSPSSPLKHWVLFDSAASDGNVLVAGDLEEPRAVFQNTVVTIPAEAIVIRMSECINSKNEDGGAV